MSLSLRTGQHSAPVVAIDLGSNSFHLLVAAVDRHGLLQPVEVRAHKVQLALDMVEGRLSAAAIARGLDCLADFAAFTRGLAPARVRVVGTQALRQAVNRQAFIDPAGRILGHPVDVVSGEDEAALAYFGVTTGLGNCPESRLVIDVGGGSTELVIGCADQVQRACSVAVGCVTGLAHFPGGEINSSHMAAAQQAATKHFAAAAEALAQPWQLAVGCSGTLLAIEQVLIRQGWSRQGISAEGLLALRQALLAFKSIDAVSFQGLKEDRRSIFATGVAIVLALFEVFRLDSMQLSAAGLREGIAWQLLQQ